MIVSIVDSHSGFRSGPPAGGGSGCLMAQSGDGSASLADGRDVVLTCIPGVGCLQLWSHRMVR